MRSRASVERPEASGQRAAGGKAGGGVRAKGGCEWEGRRAPVQDWNGSLLGARLSERDMPAALDGGEGDADGLGVELLELLRCKEGPGRAASGYFLSPFLSFLHSS